MDDPTSIPDWSWERLPNHWHEFTGLDRGRWEHNTPGSNSVLRRTHKKLPPGRVG
jgi:hypothetical protein